MLCLCFFQAQLYWYGHGGMLWQHRPLLCTKGDEGGERAWICVMPTTSHGHRVLCPCPLHPSSCCNCWTRGTEDPSWEHPARFLPPALLQAWGHVSGVEMRVGAAILCQWWGRMDGCWREQGCTAPTGLSALFASIKSAHFLLRPWASLYLLGWHGIRHRPVPCSRAREGKSSSSAASR